MDDFLWILIAVAAASEARKRREPARREALDERWFAAALIAGMAAASLIALEALSPPDANDHFGSALAFAIVLSILAVSCGFVAYRKRTAGRRLDAGKPTRPRHRPPA